MYTTARLAQMLYDIINVDREQYQYCSLFSMWCEARWCCLANWRENTTLPHTT